LPPRATAVRCTAAPGDLIPITFDQRSAGQGHGRDLLQTLPKLQDLATETAEFFLGLLILHALILYCIQEEACQHQKSQAEGRMSEAGHGTPRHRGSLGVPRYCLNRSGNGGAVYKITQRQNDLFENR
jgi:hypothetical protein